MKGVILLAVMVIACGMFTVSGERLPTVNSDNSTWGTVLNGYLAKIAGDNATELNGTMVNGSNIYPSSLNTTHIIDGTITDSDISDATNLTLGQKITFALGEVIDNIINGWVRITGGLNVTGSAVVSEDLNVTQNIYQNDSQVLNNKYTGWVEYIDTQYTYTSPFVANSTQQHFPNNNGTIRDQEKPVDIVKWWNGTHFIANNKGDAVLIRMRFKAQPQANNIYCEITNDIGGTVGELEFRSFTFPKGISQNQSIDFTNLEYQLDTWYTNGGYPLITCTGGDVNIWGLQTTVERIHIGRGTYP